MPKVNPEILVWARKTAGLSLEDASQKLQISPARGILPADRLADLEAGAVEPTRPLLVKMSKQYRRPLLVFYMSAPPRQGDRGQDFRKLPQEYSRASETVVDALIRDIKARQSMLRAALEDEDEAIPRPYVGSLKMSDGVTAVVNAMRETINLDLTEFRRQPAPVDAFALLRAKVEAVGIFVLLMGDLGSHHTEIGVDAFRGFALADEVAPFVVINDRDAKSAWSFTLIHELVHIWLGQTGISNSYAEKEIEKFCNEVSSEFLLPNAELMTLHTVTNLDYDALKQTIVEFAQQRNLSSSMVAYRLYKNEIIDHDTWLQLSQEFERLWRVGKARQRQNVREKKGGPNYYVVRQHRLGKNLISLVQRMVHSQTLTTSKAGLILGVKAKNVQKLLEVG